MADLGGCGIDAAQVRDLTGAGEGAHERVMRWLIVLLVVLLIGGAVYGYRNNPDGCAKLGTDLLADFPILATDVVAIYTTTTEPPAPGAPSLTAAVATAPAAAAAPASPPAAGGASAGVAESSPVASAPVTNAAAPASPAVAPALPPLPANTLIQNGDFSQSSDHWEGDGKSPGQYAAENRAATNDPLTSKGLIVTLNPKSWTRVYQTFRAGPGTQFSIVVNYRLSPDVSLSKDPADYTGINKLIQIAGFEHFGSFNSSPGQFYGTVGDPNSTMVALEVYTPTLGSSEVQNYQHTYPVIPVSETKTFGLAFPPGTGTVVILSAAVTSN
jgi:hypothetical protein